MRRLGKWLRPRKSWFGWGALLVVCLGSIAGVLTSDDEQPYGLDSNSDSGIRALSLLMEKYGATVRESSSPFGGLQSKSSIDSRTAILFRDDLSTDESDDLRQWVREGGTLVVATPYSRFSEPYLLDPESLTLPRLLHPSCDSELVAGVDRLQPISHGSYEIFSAEGLTTPCFPAAGGAFMVERKDGKGREILLGSGQLFTNGLLGKADNSIAAFNMLDPHEGDVVTIVKSDLLAPSGGGGKSLLEVVPDRAWAVSLQLCVALGLVALWRSRRLGAPVYESSGVYVPGSELTAASARLLHYSKQYDAAAFALRSDLRRELTLLVGLDPAADPGALADALARRSGVSRERVLDLVVGGPVKNGRALLELSRESERLRQEVANVR